jgi:phosphosulfolactate synthase (CoM biosynthesis protein A)
MGKVSTTEQAKQVLREAGYYVDNLWHVSDVMDKYECTKEEAKEVLDGALKIERYYEDNTFDAIENYATDLGLKRKEVSNG